MKARRPGDGEVSGDDVDRQTGVLDALPAGIAMLDGCGTITLANAGWRDFGDDNVLLGSRLGVGTSYLEFCDGIHGVECAEAVQVAAGIRAVLARTANGFSIEYPSPSSRGQRWFLLTVTRLADDDSKGAVLMHVDITERKQAQAAQQQLAERLTNTLDSMSDAFFTMDREWRFTFLNPQSGRLLRRDREDLLGRSYWVEFPGTLGSVFERQFRKAVADNQTVAFEEFYAPFDSWFSIRAYPSEQGLAVYFTDITHARRAAEALRASEDEFRNLAEAMPQIVWITRADGWNTYFNRQWSEYTGLGLEESLGQGWNPPFHPDDRDRATEAWQRAMDTGGMYSIECRLRRADGVYRWWLLRGVPVRDMSGRVCKWFGTFTDTHELKQAELEIHRVNQGLRESGLRNKRLNLVYAVLSEINALIVRKSDRDVLLGEACRIAVEAGGFRLAWVGIVDGDGDHLVPIASAGEVADFFERAPREVFECQPGANGRAAQALRGRKPRVVNDFSGGQQTPMEEYLEARGIHALAVIPLVVEGEAIGVFALYAQERGFFDDEEMWLLQELAGNISLAIENIDKQARLDYLAYYDPLTGLANRSLFLDRVSQHVRGAAGGGHQLALFLFDLDRFKNINDSLGRPAGDAILKQVAGLMVCRGGDASLLARVGPDVFAAVVPKVRPGGNLTRWIEEAMAALGKHPFTVEGAILRITGKVGVALFPEDGNSAERLLQQAEAALKEAKAIGDRYLFHSSAMTQAAAGKLSLENRLRRALDNGEFVLHYQPKVNLASGRVTGAEAVLRWDDPDTGLVPAGGFLAVLEETGLIHEVGRWAMRKAIEDYLCGCDAGLDGVRIAVNVSAPQLRSRGLVAEVAKCLEIDPRAASGLELEVTENMVMGDVSHAITSLQAIRAMGVTVALDDFGTGVSSLGCLARLPIDTLKIDRSFTSGMAVTADGLSLVSTIITLAHSLRLRVVAEGVESVEQSRLLRLVGCDEMQGAYFSEPVPFAEFVASFPGWTNT